MADNYDELLHTANMTQKQIERELGKLKHLDNKLAVKTKVLKVHEDDFEARRRQTKEKIASLLSKEKKPQTVNREKLDLQYEKAKNERPVKTYRDKYFEELESAKARNSPTKPRLIKTSSSVSKILPASMRMHGKPLTAKDRAKSQAINDGLFALNQKKRDLRSIEEIQLDMKKKKQKEEKIVKNEASLAKRPIIKSQATQPLEQKEEFYDSNYSSIIQNMFGYNRKKYAEYEEDYDSDDMEATNEDIEREEKQSARLARLEEEKEEELLRRRKLEKLKMKRQA